MKGENAERVFLPDEICLGHKFKKLMTVICYGWGAIVNICIISVYAYSIIE